VKWNIVLSWGVEGGSGQRIVVDRLSVNSCEGGLSCVENSVEN